MTRSRIIMVVLFVVAFGAGFSVSKLLERPHHSSERGPSWLSHELNLTDAQREQMLAIWGNFSKTGSDDRNTRRELQTQRNDAIAKLVPSDKQQALAQVNETYKKQMDEIMTRGRDRYRQAVDATKAILTAEQRQKYEQILARRDQQRKRGGSDRGKDVRSDRHPPHATQSPKNEQADPSAPAASGDVKLKQPAATTTTRPETDVDE